MTKILWQAEECTHEHPEPNVDAGSKTAVGVTTHHGMTKHTNVSGWIVMHVQCVYLGTVQQSRVCGHLC